MSRYLDPEGLEPSKPSACSRFLRYTWKTITCIFSHIFLVSLVVSYCIFGAKTFETLEKDHEMEVKKNISSIRGRIIDKLWFNLTSEPYLREENFTFLIVKHLKEFEGELLKAMNKDGWDGEEDINKVQWTFAGALFYSIIVITTIGYGHIAPKTTLGKVVTIFYAILGIPLMLLCLSNIGDVMATSFRFLYWRVCCYICTKKPKKPRRVRQRGGTIRREGGRGSYRSKTQSLRRSVRTSTRSADSGFDYGDVNPLSHSDTEIRVHEELPPMKVRGASLPRMKPGQNSRFREMSTVNQRPNQYGAGRVQQRGGSLDRRRAPKVWDPSLDLNTFPDAPVLCNKYALEGPEIESNHIQRGGIRRSFERSRGRRAVSMPRTHNYLELPVPVSPARSTEDLRPRQSESLKRPSPSRHHASPRIMSPLGYGSKSLYIEEESDTEYFDDGMSFESSRTTRIRPVPIWLCVFLVVSYIFAGAFLFTAWENWDYLDSAYFCFITLTTIGFGDFVPAKRVTENAEMSIALCSLYLLFGISLLAMSFNLVQEEVIANVKSVAKTLGIIKSDDIDDDDD
ncbi:uncharacterized protein LOC108735848 isoform X1 [Agrilus planipennis]|uniref:Uncharacterized protein LOC108735848 isoform X1 n=1 Tax=Agrilus planipennis TaxID=224129 RepID=A0A1W4WHW8_AGRPL|nr:uncharacterized protein LOC108735848 isoform X1 [Agrilus planipennis]